MASRVKKNLAQTVRNNSVLIIKKFIINDMFLRKLAAKDLLDYVP